MVATGEAQDIGLLGRIDSLDVQGVLAGAGGYDSVVLAEVVEERIGWHSMQGTRGRIGTDSQLMRGGVRRLHRQGREQ